MTELRKCETRYFIFNFSSILGVWAVDTNTGELCAWGKFVSYACDVFLTMISLEFFFFVFMLFFMHFSTVSYRSTWMKGKFLLLYEDLYANSFSWNVLIMLLPFNFVFGFLLHNLWIKCLLPRQIGIRRQQVSDLIKKYWQKNHCRIFI